MPSRVLIVHNRYIHRGGEDAVVESEARLLASRGVEVRLYEEDNHDIAGQSRLGAALDALWSRRAHARVLREIEAFRPQVLHLHNFFPRISPAVFWAARARGVATVMTLHNFRYACAQGMLLRDGRICEVCVGTAGLAGVRHRCYRQSLAQTAVLAASFGLHKALGTFRHKVCRYVALNDFCRRKFMEAGLPAERLAVKPNFVDLPPPQDGPREGGLFVGRLSPEKGLATLLAAQVLLPHARLDIVGDGPMAEEVQGSGAARCLGWLPAEKVFGLMRRAAFLALPSMWYENFPRTIVEAFACGLPVIASRLGAMAEIVEDGVTGILFEPGSAQDLARAMQYAQENPQIMRRMGRVARERYEALYGPEQNYPMLMDIYAQALVQVARPGD